jgi:hypothetical protein
VIRKSQRLLAVVLVFAMQAQSFASTGGMLRVNGSAQVDGTSVPGSMAIVQGQLISTEASSSATLEIGSTKIFISPNTVVKYLNPQEVFLSKGGLYVDTDQQVRTDLSSCAVVFPIGNNTAGLTKYEVQLQGNDAYVYARELPVTVHADRKSIDLKPQTMAVVHNYMNSNCTAAYYNDEMTPAMKFLLAGSATAAIATGFGIGRQKVSADHP